MFYTALWLKCLEIHHSSRWIPLWDTVIAVQGVLEDYAIVASLPWKPPVTTSGHYGCNSTHTFLGRSTTDSFWADAHRLVLFLTVCTVCIVVRMWSLLICMISWQPDIAYSIPNTMKKKSPFCDKFAMRFPFPVTEHIGFQRRFLGGRKRNNSCGCFFSL